jgi:dienelactone hydrolase
VHAAAAILGLLTLPQQPAGPDLAAYLARAVDRPTAAARREHADRLARQPGATVDDWLAACAAFGRFEAKEPGPTRQTVELQVLDRVEATEVFLYVPRGYDPGTPAPLLLWGHGAGGSGAREYVLWQQVADQVGMFVLAVTEFGDEPGWGSTPRERAAQLAALRWARRTVNVDENAVFVGGWSRGGHMTWDLMLRHPDLWAGALPIVGGPRMQLGAGNNLRYLENVKHLPIRDLQGGNDDPLLLRNLRLAFERLAKFGAGDAALHEFPERGHDADLTVVDWAVFFTRRREARPAQVVRLAADADEARAAWARITAFDRRVAVEVAPQVDARQWQRLDDAGKAALLLDKLADHTARLAVEDRGQGRFVAQGRGVQSFVLSLVADQVGSDGAVEVRWRHRTQKHRVEPTTAVLLRDFVERFDRTSLPVARVEVR